MTETSLQTYTRLLYEARSASEQDDMHETLDADWEGVRAAYRKAQYELIDFVDKHAHELKLEFQEDEHTGARIRGLLGR